MLNLSKLINRVNKDGEKKAKERKKREEQAKTQVQRARADNPSPTTASTAQSHAQSNQRGRPTPIHSQTDRQGATHGNNFRNIPTPTVVPSPPTPLQGQHTHYTRDLLKPNEICQENPFGPSILDGAEQWCEGKSPPQPTKKPPAEKRSIERSPVEKSPVAKLPGEKPSVGKPPVVRQAKDNHGPWQAYSQRNNGGWKVKKKFIRRGKIQLHFHGQVTFHNVSERHWGRWMQYVSDARKWRADTFGDVTCTYYTPVEFASGGKRAPYESSKLTYKGQFSMHGRHMWNLATGYTHVNYNMSAREGNLMIRYEDPPAKTFRSQFLTQMEEERSAAFIQQPAAAGHAENKEQRKRARTTDTVDDIKQDEPPAKRAKRTVPKPQPTVLQGIPKWIGTLGQQDIKDASVPGRIVIGPPASPKPHVTSESPASYGAYSPTSRIPPREMSPVYEPQSPSAVPEATVVPTNIQEDQPMLFSLRNAAKYIQARKPASKHALTSGHIPEQRLRADEFRVLEPPHGSADERVVTYDFHGVSVDFFTAMENPQIVFEKFARQHGREGDSVFNFYGPVHVWIRRINHERALMAEEFTYFITSAMK